MILKGEYDRLLFTSGHTIPFRLRVYRDLLFATITSVRGVASASEFLIIGSI